MHKNETAAFFSRGNFVRNQLARLVIACIFACYTLSAFCLTMNALLTDHEMASFRSCYHHGTTRVNLIAIETCTGDWKHGTETSQIDLTEQQIQTLTEYAGDSLEIIDGDSYTYAKISLSGDWKKDRKFIKNMRHKERGWVGFQIKTSFAPRVTFDRRQIGVGLEAWESILLFLSVGVSSIVTAVLFSKRRAILCDSTFKNGSIPSKKTFLLQGTFLLGVMFIASVLFAYIGIWILNVRWHVRGSYPPFIVPGPISALLTLLLGAALVLPYAVPKRRVYKSLKNQNA